MNHVERFRAVMHFQPVDRLPCVEWAPWWDQTIDRWAGEGLDAALVERFRATDDPAPLCEHFGLDPWKQYWFRPRANDFPRTAHGIGAIQTEADYDRLKNKLFPPVDQAMVQLAQWGKSQREGKLVVWITVEGFFWFPRTLFGIEPHLLGFYDQPELMHRMNADLAEHSLSIFRQLAKVCPPAFMTFAEDMSYNHGPMLSRQLFDEFLRPYYLRVIPALQEMGTVIICDSDGQVGPLIPWLEAVGVEGILPLERMAGVDGATIRAAHPRWRMIGHFDKTCMHKGEGAMRQEFERLMPLMRQGGFVPGVDHQTPPGVSLEQYRLFVRLLKEYASRVG